MSYIKEFELKNIIRRALKEDVGRGDITTERFIPKNKRIKAVILAKEEFILCGINIAQAVFKTADKNIKFRALFRDGQKVRSKSAIAKVEGNARNILSAERVALNFLSLLSAVSSKTRRYLLEIKPHKTKIIDTRKTIPGLRILEKYAVRIGGGFNHRFCLDEMMLLKDNHLKILGGYRGVERLKNKRYPLELEVKNLKEFKKALRLNPDVIMLDNMKLKDMRKALAMKRKIPAARKIIIEASGGITLNNIKKVAACGVNTISIGDLTHSIDSVDISLEVQDPIS